MRLTGKIAVITGGASGIGRGIALCMAREGADVVIPELNLQGAQQVADEAKAMGRKALAVNIKSHFIICKAIAPHMMARRYGKIINIASIAGKMGSQSSPPYTVSKAGVISFTQVLAKDLAPFNINVNAICPGLLWTPLWQGLGEAAAKANPRFAGITPRQVFEQRVQEWVPLGREQTPEDIGHLAVFLASEEAKNITGQAINVDGGIVMH